MFSRLGGGELGRNKGYSYIGEIKNVALRMQSKINGNMQTFEKFHELWQILLAKS